MTTQQKREEIINRCKFELATNFDCPSEQILGVYGSRIGLSSRDMFNLISSDLGFGKER
jgi:hypothetical protein